MGLIVTATFTTIKNESEYLDEWIAWHKMLGFDKVILMDDCSEDNPEAVIGKWGDFVIYSRKPEGIDRQVDMFNHALGIYDYDWMLFTDIDEFLYCPGLDAKKWIETFDSETVEIPTRMCSPETICGNTNDFVIKRFPYYVDAVRFESCRKIWMKPSSKLKFATVHELTQRGVKPNDAYLYHFKYKTPDEIESKISKWRASDHFSIGYNLHDWYKNELELLSTFNVIKHNLADNCEKLEMLIPINPLCNTRIKTP